MACLRHFVKLFTSRAAGDPERRGPWNGGTLATAGGLLLFYAGTLSDAAGLILFGIAIALHIVRTKITNH